MSSHACEPLHGKEKQRNAANASATTCSGRTPTGSRWSHRRVGNLRRGGRIRVDRDLDLGRPD
ncbi:MAG: hypothetical protein ABIP38_01665, partial [Steroidobacteraceae bacterium]